MDSTPKQTIKTRATRVHELPAIFSGARRFLILRLIANGLIQAVLLVGSMLLVRFAFDILLNPAYDDPEVHLYDMNEVWLIALFALGLLACSGGAAWLRMVARIDAERLGQSYVHRIRMRLFDRMKHFSPRAMSQRSTGTSTLRFLGDLSALRRWVSLGLAQIVVAGIVCICAIGFMATLDYSLALGSAVVLLVGLLGNLFLGPYLHRTVSEARRVRGRLAGNINEKIRSFTVIQAFNQHDRERRRFRKQSNRLREAMVKRAKTTAIMRVNSDGASAGSMGLILSYGAWEVFQGHTSAGNVVAAMAMVGFLATAFRDLGRVHEYYQNYRVSKDMICRFLSTKPLRGRSQALPKLEVSEGTLEFCNIHLSGIIKDVSGIVPGGNRLILHGPNGSGKSTLMQIASRLIDPDEGQVLIDRQDIRKCEMASVRRVVGLISPDLPLLRGSVRYNLRYRWPDASEEEVHRVATLCELDDLLQSLPGGEKFRLQEGGQNLSLGQRHRLMIARALLGSPKLLIVDEMDANLDPDAAKVLDRVIDDYPGTIVMVTRNPKRKAKADLVWHLSNGHLIKMEKIPSASQESL